MLLTPLGLNEFRPLLDDETQAVPFLNHVLRAIDDSAGPRDLRPARFRKYVIGPLRWPPCQLTLLGTIDEVRLPGHRELLGDIARLEVRGIQPERFGILIFVPEKPARFDSGKQRPTHTGLQSRPVEPLWSYRPDSGGRPGPIINKI